MRGKGDIKVLEFNEGKADQMFRHEKQRKPFLNHMKGWFLCLHASSWLTGYAKPPPLRQGRDTFPLPEASITAFLTLFSSSVIFHFSPICTFTNVTSSYCATETPSTTADALLVTMGKLPAPVPHRRGHLDGPRLHQPGGAPRLSSVARGGHGCVAPRPPGLCCSPAGDAKATDGEQRKQHSEA